MDSSTLTETPNGGEDDASSLLPILGARHSNILKRDLKDRPNDPFVLFNLAEIAVEWRDWSGAMDYSAVMLKSRQHNELWHMSRFSVRGMRVRAVSRPDSSGVSMLTPSLAQRTARDIHA
jgi:hypothetical protein